LRVVAAAAAVALGSGAVLARSAADLHSAALVAELEIRSGWAGVSAEQAEEQLTSVLEGEAESLRGVRQVRSLTEVRQGKPESVVRIVFARGSDLGYARLELSQRLAALRRVLPASASAPVVSLVLPEGSEGAVPRLRYLVVPAAGGIAAAAQASSILAAALRAIPGIAVHQQPEPAEALLVEVDGERGLPALAADAWRGRMASAARVRSVTPPAGEGGFPVVVEPPWRDLASLAQLPALPPAPRPELGVVSRVRLGMAEPSHRVRVDGRGAAELIIETAPGERSRIHAQGVREAVARAAAALPAGSRLLLVEDSPAAASAREALLRARALLGVALAASILLAGFGAIRTAVIPLLCAALAALVGTAGLRLLAGPAGMCEMAGVWVGFLLAIGKSAQVVNGVAGTHGGSSPAHPRRSARVAARLAPAMVDTSAMLAAALLPLLALDSEPRQRYLPLFAAALAVDAAGLLLAFTLAPALALHASDGWRWTAVPKRVWGDRDAARSPLPPVLVLAGLLAVSVWTARRFERYVPRGEPVPRQQADGMITARVEMPRGSTLPATAEAARRLEAAVLGQPAAGLVVTRVWPQSAELRVTLRDGVNRGQGLALRARLEAVARQTGGAEVQVEGLGGSQHPAAVPPPRYFIRVSGYSERGVAALADQVATRLAGYPRVRSVDSHASTRWDPRGEEREVVVELDPLRLGRYGADAGEVSTALAAALEGQPPRAILESGERELPLYLSVRSTPPLALAGLGRFEVPLRAGGIIRLGSLAALHSGPAVSRIERIDQEYQRLVAWEFMGPARLGERVRAEVMRATALPVGYRLEPPQPARPEGESSSFPLYRALAAGVGLTLLLSAALLESATAPLRLLVSLAAAATGVMAAFGPGATIFSRDAAAGCLLAAGTLPGLGLALAIPTPPAWGRNSGGSRVRPGIPWKGGVALPGLLLFAGLAPFVIRAAVLPPELSRALLLPPLGASAGMVLLATPALWAIPRLRGWGGYQTRFRANAARAPQVTGRSALEIHGR
jgi:multidrug efflux pump subunit AcrB